MKTKLVSTRFGGTFGTIKFDEKSVFTILLSFTPYWDYKLTNSIHADSPGVYTIEKLTNLGTVDKTLLKCDVIDESVVNSVRQPILYSFVLDKPSAYKVICEPEIIPFKI